MSSSLLFETAFISLGVAISCMILETKLASIAKRDLITIDQNASVLSAAKLMVERGIGSLVVTGKGQPVGIITERDLLKKVVAVSRNSESTKVGEVMTSNPVTIDLGRSLGEALELMNRRKVRRMLVTEGGKIVGIFTQRDVLAINRVCLHCGKEIRSALEFKGEAEPCIECECGARYHAKCAKMVVHCVDCSRTLVTHVIYPEPWDTTGG